MTVPSRIVGDASVPSLGDLHALALKRFGKNVCNFQLEFSQAQVSPLQERTGELLSRSPGIWSSPRFGRPGTENLAEIFSSDETSAHTLSFAFLELAKHPEIQKKLWDEIRATRATIRARGDTDLSNRQASRLILLP